MTCQPQLWTDQVHDDVIKWKHFPRHWPFVRGIHRSPVNSPHKGQRRGALMFSLIYAWTNGWVSNREAGDLTRHWARYGVTATRKCSPLLPLALITGARLDARTYTFAHPIWRTINAARKQGAISPILPVFCRYYLCDAIMLIKLSTVWPWVTGITTLEVAIVIVNFARDARMNTVNMCRMRERIKEDARTSLLMRERTHIVRCGSFN